MKIKNPFFSYINIRLMLFIYNILLQPQEDKQNNESNREYEIDGNEQKNNSDYKKVPRQIKNEVDGKQSDLEKRIDNFKQKVRKQIKYFFYRKITNDVNLELRMQYLKEQTIQLYEQLENMIRNVKPASNY